MSSENPLLLYIKVFLYNHLFNVKMIYKIDYKYIIRGIYLVELFI